MSEDIDAAILIVDDNTKNLQLLAEMLIAKGYHKIALAKDGHKAINFINKKKPDLILLDISMPGMDGFEVCRRLKQMEDTKDIPVIFISALSDTEDKVKGFEMGGVDYVTKPFQREEVLARVRTHLKLKQMREKLENAYDDLQRAYNDLEIAARTDGLTRLSNRRDIIEKFEYEKIRSERNGQSLSIILSDIDDFKLFNDQYGHDCGDYVLINVAKTIRSRLRKQDTAARWGGEEFLILLPETDIMGAKHVAQSIQDRLDHESFTYKDIELKPSMTFGVCDFIDGEDIDLCIKRADQMMYEGKKRGKNTIVLTSDDNRP